jgi:hypothetical protein
MGVTDSATPSVSDEDVLGSGDITLELFLERIETIESLF